MSATSYRTIDASTEGLFRDKGSKFIAYAYPIHSDQEVKDRLSALKLHHPKARHHCWAYRLTPDRTVFRLNDDGEPTGTAGRPILNTLLSHDVTNIMVVVVRYFGGTLLGVPGLINAYKTAAQEALTAANIIELTVNDRFVLAFDYPQLNQVMRIIKEGGLKLIKQNFDNRCTVTMEIPRAQKAAILHKLNNIADLIITEVGTSGVG
ncbi:YigZ family protein [Parapedobacter lycopersici]|uniref:IMPACT family protein n=1 Tax=Parapedobacter lycopersici TaxID=1864939 RepID=UPI00333E714E